MLDFRIETFLCVCKYMNFTKASAALNITQPAVSQHIHYLEDEYSAKLFEYKNRKLSLTPAGEELYRAALTMKHDDRILAKRMKLAGQPVRKLSFGATLTVGEFLFPAKVASYLEANPRTDIRMTIRNTHELLEMIDSGAIDFAVIEGYFPMTEYGYRTYSLEPYAAVYKTGYQFKCGHTPNSIRDLLCEPLLIREEGSGTREILERYLAGTNLSLDDFEHTLEVDSIHVIKQLALAGCGITFLYQIAVKEELLDGRLELALLPGLDAKHEFSFVWRKDSIYKDEYDRLFELFS